MHNVSTVFGAKSASWNTLLKNKVRAKRYIAKEKVVARESRNMCKCMFNN